MLCMLFLSTLRQTESLPSEDPRQVELSGGQKKLRLRMGYLSAVPAESPWSCPGGVSGTTGPAVTYTSRALGNGANGWDFFPSWAWTWYRSFLVSELESSIPGGEAIKGVIWSNTWVYFSSIGLGLLLFRAFGSFSFTFKSLLSIGTQTTMVALRWNERLQFMSEVFKQKG